VYLGGRGIVKVGELKSFPVGVESRIMTNKQLAVLVLAATAIVAVVYWAANKPQVIEVHLFDHTVRQPNVPPPVDLIGRAGPIGFAVSTVTA